MMLMTIESKRGKRGILDSIPGNLSQGGPRKCLIGDEHR